MIRALLLSIRSLFRRRPEPVRMVGVRVSGLDVPTAWRKGRRP